MLGTFTASIANSPSTSTLHSPPSPARSAWKTSTNTENSPGARNATARPAIAYKPTAIPPIPSFAIRSSRVRADDWVGPMNTQSNSPQAQNARGPDSVIKVMPTVIIATSDPTMTALDPIRSSSSPPSTAPTAATTLAAIPKISTSPAETPYTLTPSTAPKANTPDRPSRKTALASR